MDGCQEWAWLNGRGCGGNLISRTWWGSVISSWLKENLKAQPRYRCTVCVMGLLPTTRQPGSLNRELGDCARQTNSNVMLWPPPPLDTNTHMCSDTDTQHTGLRSCCWLYYRPRSIYIHDIWKSISQAWGCSQVHTLRFTLRDHFCRFQTSGWNGYPVCLRKNWSEELTIHRVYVCTSKYVHVCFSHAYILYMAQNNDYTSMCIRSKC